MVTLQENISLRSLNTFGIDAKARYAASIRNHQALVDVMNHSVFHNGRRLILGGGSNILFTQDFDGLILLNAMEGKRVISETIDEIVVEVGSGENWHAFVLYCIDHGWGGIENLSLIPGTTGAAPIQNIGAYGVEIRRVLEWVDGIDLVTGTSRRMTPEECSFGYRDSVFKHTLREKFFISSITLRLTKRDHRLDIEYGALRQVLEQKKITAPTVRDVSDAVISIRQSKLPDPSVIGNAGSFFKNPEVDAGFAKSLQDRFPKMPSYPSENQMIKIPAGWLIEQCGWKGKKFGQTGVHEQQALVLVNFGSAKGEEILALSNRICESVEQKFGIKLTPEVNII